MAENLTDWLTDEDLIQPFVGLGQFYGGQGLYSQAEPWCKQCLENTQNRLGQQHPDVAASLKNLASLYNSQGKYEQAEPLLRQALSIAETVLGVDHPNTKQVQENLDSLLESKSEGSGEV